MKHAYPAVSTPSGEGSAVEFSGSVACSVDAIAEATAFAMDACELWLSDAERVGMEIPTERLDIGAGVYHHECA